MCVRVEECVGAGLVFGYRSDVLRVILTFGVGNVFEDLEKVGSNFRGGSKEMSCIYRY